MGWTMMFVLLMLHYGETTATKRQPDHDEITRLASSVNEFGHRLLLENMKQHPTENIAISPASLAGLLAMTLLGSVGNTYEELADTLGFSQDILKNRQNHEDFGHLLRMLNVNNTWTQTLYADALFVDPEIKIRTIYESYLQRVYNGDIIPAHFKQPKTVRSSINEWAKNKTNGKIEQFLEKKLADNIKIVLLSALYFSGQWTFPFYLQNTLKLPFETPTKEVLVDLMLNAGKFNYTLSEEDELQMMSLPYSDSFTNMYILMPRRKSLSDLMARLSYAKINELIEKMKLRSVVLRFPKMELSSKLNMQETLKTLGVKSIFNEENANLALMVDTNSKIVNRTEIELLNRINIGTEDEDLRDRLTSLPNPGVHVDTILHNVKITINEFGTEAAAVSGAVLSKTAILFYASSPFYFFIRNERTKLLTFSAVVFDPTA